MTEDASRIESDGEPKPVNKSEPTKVDLRELFLGLQTQLEAHLQTNRAILKHPGTKGDAAELDWVGMLEEYLPYRYQVAKAFVMDADGTLSEQIDVVVFDRQYCPFLFNQSGARYVPAESVYAVFEVKQSMGKGEIQYAGHKVATVRRLRRTSSPIIHAGGEFTPKTPFPPLGGVLCLESTWKPPFGAAFQEALRELDAGERLDIGCALRHGAFEVRYEGAAPFVNESTPERALIFFFLRLLQRLQALGTVPAIDWTDYGRALNE